MLSAKQTTEINVDLAQILLNNPTLVNLIHGAQADTDKEQMTKKKLSAKKTAPEFVRIIVPACWFKQIPPWLFAQNSCTLINTYEFTVVTGK